MKIVDKIIWGLLISVIFFSCRQPDSEYYLYYYKPSYPQDTTINKFKTDYNVKKNKSRYELTYINLVDTITYILEQDSTQISKARHGNGTFRNLTWDKKILTNQARDTVYKFTIDTHIIDGGFAYYWSREFGVFLIQSTTWPNSTILQTGDKEKNRKINKLINNSCPNKQLYFNGQVENILSD